MLSLRLSPATIRPTTPSSRTIRRRPPVLKVSFRRGTSGRRPGGGGALSAKMSDAPDAYARALSDVANSLNILDSVFSDLEKLEKIFSQPEATLFFTNQTISVDEKHELIEEIVKGSDFQPQTANFLRVLVDNERVDILPAIMQDYEKYYNELTGTEVVVVTSVVRLESQDLAQIAQAVQKMTGAKNVRIKTEIDESLIGGFTICYGRGSRFIDMSIKKQLEEIESNLVVSDLPATLLSV